MVDEIEVSKNPKMNGEHDDQKKNKKQEIKGLDKKFEVDVLWNLISLGFLAISGIVLNVLIGSIYGSATLGVFNVAFALYIVLSQFGVFGIHMSVMKYVSQHADTDRKTTEQVIADGFLLVLLTSSVVTAISYLARPLITELYHMDGLSTAYLALLPGLWCFSLNKYLLNVINALRHMRALAIFQSLRFVLIMVALFGVVIFKIPSAYLTGVISFSELILTPILFIYVSTEVKLWKINFYSGWMKKHLNFGYRVFLSGTITELNTRVDVLMIGLYLDATKVGIYSVAILIVEGLSQAAFVIRNNVNPLLTKFITNGEINELRAFTRKIALYFFLFMVVCGSLVVALYPFAANIAFGDNRFADAHLPLAILVAGFVMASPYLPFTMIMSQAGRPATHTGFMVIILFSNAIFNFFAIPIWGIAGAALATAGSYIVSMLVLSVLMRKYIGLRIYI